MMTLQKKEPVMRSRQLPLKSVALILAGGRGSRLKDLTATRAKPAVHFGGKFRIIDFALSNCLKARTGYPRNKSLKRPSRRYIRLALR